METTRIFVPTTKEMINKVAKSIALERFKYAVQTGLAKIDPNDGNISQEIFDMTIEHRFNQIWDGNTPEDDRVREEYTNDAICAINCINLSLATLPKSD